MLTLNSLSGRFVWTQYPIPHVDPQSCGHQENGPERIQHSARTCRALRALGLLTVMLLTQAVALAAVASDPALDAALGALSTLQPGQDLQQFQPIEAAMTVARTDATARAELESRLVSLLQGNSSDMAKDYTCRQLARIGSDACVPALAALLPHARVSHMARQALESLGSPACRAVLREALTTVKGRPLVGIVTSLGALRDGEAAGSLAGLLNEMDSEICEAAVVALGRIGTAAAVMSLQEFSGHAPAALRDRTVDALLSAAVTLARTGDEATSLAAIASLDNATDERVRAAALRARIMAQPTAAVALILTNLAAEEAWQREVAADYLRSVRDSTQLETVAAALPTMPAAGQLAALDALCRMPDGAARDAALKMLESADLSVQIAAVGNLVWSGTADDVPRLLDLTTRAADPTLRAAALETLRVMPAAGVNAAILTAFDQDAGTTPSLVRLALARRAAIFTTALLNAAKATNAETRLAALEALEIMATPVELDALIALLIQSAPGDEREAADRAVWRCCQQIADPVARTTHLLTAIQKGQAAERCALLPTLARCGGTDALAAVHESMQSSDSAERDAGYRALANWPDATVADELLQIARAHDVEAYRFWALRAYARVVSLPSERDPQATFAMLRDAWELATRQQDKELILSRLGTVRTPEALALLVSMLEQPALRDSSIRAVYESAKGLSQTHPEPARAALEKILTLTDDAALKQQIPKVLRDMDVKQP